MQCLLKLVRAVQLHITIVLRNQKKERGRQRNDREQQLTRRQFRRIVNNTLIIIYRVDQVRKKGRTDERQERRKNNKYRI